MADNQLITQRIIVAAGGTETLVTDGTYTCAPYAGNGGAVEILSSGTVTGENVSFVGNTAIYGGAICNGGAIALGGATFSGNTATQGGAIYNTGTVSITSAITLATDSDTWVNVGNDSTELATVNWNLTGETTACINGFEYFSNGKNTRQTITVSANQPFGSHVIATGKVSGAIGKDTFTLTGVAGQDDVTIAIYQRSVVYNDHKYSLYVNDGGTPEVLTDDALVLTIASMAVADKVTVTSETGPESNPYDLGSGETYTVPTVSDSGGAVGVRTDAYATGEALTFSGNTAHFGGAVYVEYGHLTFTDDGTDAGILFYNNASTSKGSGGALYTIGSETKRSTITFQDDVEFTQNMVSDGYNGGALCSTYSDIVFEKSATFTDNGVRPFAEDAFGGALYNGSTATITFRDDVVFSGNLATGVTGDLCGAVYNSATITFAKAMTLATETDTFYNNGGALIWDISAGTDSYAHLNQYNRLNNASDNGELVFMTSGTQELGDYVVASNVETLSRANSSFIVRGRANDARGLAFTFGSSPVFYNGCAYTIGHNATDHTLVLTTAERPAAGTYKFMVDSAMGASAEAAYNLNQDADANGAISRISGIREGAVMISEGAFATATNLTVSQNTVTCGNFLEACGAGLTNYGGNVAFYGAGSGESNQTRFSGNTISASDGGSSIANGGAIFTIGGTFAFHNAAVFFDNVATGINVTGAAIYNEKGTFVFHDNVSFDGNTASGGNFAQGGAINNVNSSVIFESDVAFSNNAAMAASAYGGAIMNAEGSIQFLGNVTFTNNAASSVAGAIVNADKMTFAKTMTLTGGTVANADTIYNMGVLNWDISQGDPATAGSYAVLNGFEKLFNDEGSLTITVSASQTDGRYVIATGDLTDVEGKNSFTLTGVAGVDDVALTIGGDKVTYNERDYTLAIENDNLVLTAALHGYALTSTSNIPGGGVNFSVGGKAVTRAGENDIVTLDSINVAGYTFLGFSSNNVTITGSTFTMPAKDVTVKANYEVTVNPGAFYSSTWTSGQSIDVTWHNTQYSGTVGDGKFFNNYADAKTQVASTSDPIVVLESSTLTSVQHYDAQNVYLSGENAVYNRMILGGELISGSHSYTGDYTVNIDGGTFIREVAGGDASNKYVDRTGNITLNITGGVFAGQVVGGGYYSNNALGIYQMTGDVHLSISGGVFQQRVYAGCASFTEETSALVAMEGDVFLTIDASTYAITFGECVAAGNRGFGLLVGSTNVTVTGNGANLNFADTSVLFGGCSGDYYKGDGGKREAVTSVVDPATWGNAGVRALTFDNFTGDFNAEIRMFSDIAFENGTNLNFADSALDLKEVGKWNFDCASCATNLNKNKFAGDTINIDVTALTKGSWTLLSGDASAFADLESAKSVKFGDSVATWSDSAWSDGSYTLAFDSLQSSLIISKLA